MNFIDFTWPTPAENLAGDEAWLEFFEANGGDGLLRFWEPESYFVVVGYANHVATEVNQPACVAAGVPIFRRCSGGGTVLQGPGCLNYTLILKIEEDGPLHSITAANRFIMEQNRAALEPLILTQATTQNPQSQTENPKLAVHGHTDLTLLTHDASRATHQKFSGNAQRRKKQFLLFHGTFLLQFKLPLVEQFLRMPSKQPDYRQNRSHENFLTNYPASATAVKSALQKIWCATEPLEVIPHETIASLTRDKYATDAWNFKF